MDNIESTPVPTEMLPNLMLAATELRELSSHLEFSETLALDRGTTERAITPAELEIENRISQELERAPENLSLIRSVAESHPETLELGVQALLAQPQLDAASRAAFEEAIAREGKTISEAAIAVSDRLSQAIERERTERAKLDGGNPPVSGGSSLACDLLLVADMAAGATCVIGCGPCCVAGAAGVLTYVALC